MKCRPLVINQESLFTLETDDLGALYLEVMCGGIAMFPVRVKLDSEETRRYHEDGVTFLKKLAYSIAHNWEAFKPRVDFPGP